MLKRRLIPVVLMRNGIAVQSKGFRRYQALGNPVMIVERLSDWASDELIYLDISKSDAYDLGRDDLGASNRADPLSILEDIASKCFMPLTFGGRVRSLSDAERRVARGADKIAVNTAALLNPAFVTELAGSLGSQCVVVNIDAARTESGWEARAPGPDGPAHSDAIAWAREVADRGAGEILLQSIDRDGRGNGYDLELVAAVAAAVSVPVIALGGAGTADHLVAGLDAGAEAVAAANMFNYTEQAVYKAKVALESAGADVRAPALAGEWAAHG